MSEFERMQRSICERYGSPFVAAESDSKTGIAVSTLGSQPLNAMRTQPGELTSGWYIWCGEELSRDNDFFEPLHTRHLSRYCPEILKYLALGAGWRVLLGPERADVWFDAKLIDPSPGI